MLLCRTISCLGKVSPCERCVPSHNRTHTLTYTLAAPRVSSLPVCVCLLLAFGAPIPLTWPGNRTAWPTPSHPRVRAARLDVLTGLSDLICCWAGPNANQARPPHFYSRRGQLARRVGLGFEDGFDLLAAGAGTVLLLLPCFLKNGDSDRLSSTSTLGPLSTCHDSRWRRAVLRVACLVDSVKTNY